MAVITAATQWILDWNGPWILYAWLICWLPLAWLICPIPERITRSGRSSLVVMAAAVAAVCVLHFLIQRGLWKSMSFGYHDIGLYVRASANAALGRGLWVDSLGRSILGEHTFFALWLFVPLCRMGCDPMSLFMVASAVSLSGSALIFAWFAKRVSGSAGIAAVVAAAWLLLPMHACLVVAHGYGFHEMYLAVPLLAWGLALGELRRMRAAAFVMLLTLFVREDLALTVGAWGLYIALAKKRPGCGFAVVVAAAVYLAAAIWWIVPCFRGDAYPHLTFHFTDTTGVLSMRAMSADVSFLVTLLFPMAFLPLLNWRLALVAVPAVAETLLTTNWELHNIGFQYYVPAVPVLFIASIVPLLPTPVAAHTPKAGPRPQSSRLPAGFDPRRASMLLMAGFVSHVYLGIGPLSNNPATPTAHETLLAALPAVERVRAVVPEEASVSASYRIAAHFLDADRLWTVANDELGDVVVVHDADMIDEHLPRTALVRAQRAGGYQPIYADYHLVALARRDEPTPLAANIRLAARPADIPSKDSSLGEGIVLDAMKVEDAGPAGQRRVVLVWRRDATAPSTEADRRFGLVCGDMRWGPFYFARGAYPTNTWEDGVFYRDDIVLDAPAGQPIRIDDLRVVLLE